MRNFELEQYFSKWEFNAKHHMTASDSQSMSVEELLGMADFDDHQKYMRCHLSYTETWGAPDLREAISQTYDTIAVENVLCFAGAEEGIYTAMRVLLEPEDHAIIFVPNYQAAETIPLDICEVTGIALDPNNHWQFSLDEVASAIKDNTKLISINFPNNPTGAIPSIADFTALIELCRKHDIYLFSDEVYRLLESDESKRLPQAADIYEKGFSLNVCSKAYGFPGLRIGWIASQQTELLQAMERYKHYLSICNSAPSERLAVIMLKNRDKILETNRNRVAYNIQKLDEFFSDFPKLFEWQKPDGGCIAYPKFLGEYGVENFCKRLIEEVGVLLLPSSIYHSELMDTPTDRFRIGCGRDGIDEGLTAMYDFISTHYYKL